MNGRKTDINARPRVRPLQRLSIQLALLLSLLICAAIIVLGWITIESQMERDIRNAKGQAIAHVKHIRSLAGPLLIGEDLASLEQFLLDMIHLPNVTEALVTDPRGKVLSHALGDTEGMPVPDYGQKALPVPEKPGHYLEIRRNHIHVWEPIKSGGVIGWAHLRFSLKEARDQSRVIALKTAAIAGGVLLANLLLLWLFLRRPLSLLRMATDFADRLVHRHGLTLPEQPGPAELVDLRMALNRASMELHVQDRLVTASTDALRESENQLSRLLDQAPDGIAIIGLDGKIQRLNPAALELAGRPAGELLGRNFAETQAMTPESLVLAQEAFARVLGGEEIPVLELVIVRPDGARAAVEVRPKLLMHQDQPAGVQIMMRDITDRKQAEALNTRLGRMLETSANELYIFNAEHLRFEQVSSGAQANLGYTMDELRTMTPLDIKPEFSRNQFDALLQPLRQGTTGIVSFEAVHRRKDGSTYPVEIRLQYSPHETPPVFMAVVQDISERKQTQERLSYLANFDTLTGLPNRTLLTEKLDQAVVEANRHQRLLAVMFIDLDNFKVVNDSLGHEAGDELLRNVSRSLMESVRAGDTVARLGGDEFVVLLSNVAHIDDISRIASKIRERIGQPVTIQNRKLVVTPSIGITVYPIDDAFGKDLLKNADAAMYHAKTRGRDNYQFYTSELNVRAERRLAIEQGLRTAVEHDELELHYQPQIDIRSGRLIGAEALLRWRHPRWGMVQPLDFIPVAEETGLIHHIGEWVLKTACQQVKAWQDRMPEGFKIAVNLSGRQFDDADLTAIVAGILARTGIRASQLDVEITESLLMKNLEEVAKTLERLGESGVTISMDDFGTGYSSLSYLQRLPLDILKIDRSFVRDITDDTSDAAIARAIIVLAHSLDIRVIAEGVETEAQLAFLRKNGCDAMQGYLVAKPMPAAEFLAWHESRQDPESRRRSLAK